MSLTDTVVSIYKSTLFRRHDDDGSIFYFSAADFSGMVATPYSFKNKKGEKLSGNFYSYENPIANRLVILDHGMGMGHRAYMREIEMLARHGYLVYSYDHTGCTESEGENIGGFAGSLSDLDACISSIKSHPEYSSLKISVFGHSWGGFSTMNILALHPDIEAAVCISGFISVRDMQRQVVPFFFAKARRTLYDLEAELSPEYVTASALDSVSNTDARVLLIHSTDDKTVSYSKHFKKLIRAASGRDNVRLLTVKGKNHNPNYTREAVYYKEAFMKEHDRAAKEGRLSTEEQKAAFISHFDFYKMTEQDEAVWAEIFRTLDN
jgi:alpha-beta hydrolase superfamily lysophospholipase